jgi:hypothetical protein
MASRPSSQRRASGAPPGTTAIPIHEAAARLGISLDAARKRLVRGTLPGERTPTGWAVYWTELDTQQDGSAPPGAPVPDAALVAELRARIVSLQDETRYLRQTLDGELERHAEEIRRRDHLIAGLIERVPELPATIESPGASVTHEKAPQSDESAAETESGLRRFWRRVLGR